MGATISTIHAVPLRCRPIFFFVGNTGTSVHTDDGRYMVKLCASTSWNEAKNVVTGMFKTDTVGVEDG